MRVVRRDLTCVPFRAIQTAPLKICTGDRPITWSTVTKPERGAERAHDTVTQPTEPRVPKWGKRLEDVQITYRPCDCALRCGECWCS